MVAKVLMLIMLAVGLGFLYILRVYRILCDYRRDNTTELMYINVDDVK